jgi:DMSO/TMAO reductase YedYZ heme-binding membrane subunit
MLHPIPLLFAKKVHFGVLDVLYPVHSPQQPLVNTLGAIALYLLVLTVVTSHFRARVGRQRWKALHYLTYLVAALFVVHGAVTDQHLNDSPLDLLDAEKVGIMACGVAIATAAVARFRWTRRHPKYKPAAGTNRASPLPTERVI